MRHEWLSVCLVSGLVIWFRITGIASSHKKYQTDVATVFLETATALLQNFKKKQQNEQTKESGDYKKRKKETPSIVIVVEYLWFTVQNMILRESHTSVQQVQHLPESTAPFGKNK